MPVIVAFADAPSHAVVTQVGTTFALLLLAVAVSAFCTRTRLPFTAMLVLVGIALAQLAGHGPRFLLSFSDYRISPEVILFVFLPTLIFESAFNLDGRQLQKNLLPVLTLAIPGLLLSTAIIGIIVSALTPIPLWPALLLGAILSATDPIAVISLFKQLGAPKRLTVLVEGESLFNDATSIVLAGILLDVVMRGLTGETAVFGVVEFFKVFLGGIVVGLVLAWVVGSILARVKHDSFIEISLTTILAYASFLIAEHLFHVSGVMATVMAGIMMGGWGRTKLSASLADFLHHFWEFIAYVANSLIFLLVGLSVVLLHLWESAFVLLGAVLAMLLSRAVVIFILVPIAGKLSEPVDIRYQTIMYWGGLRGAIALAIALRLPDGFTHKETFIAVVTGAVLFTLLVQGLSIEKLMRRLQLDKPPVADVVARLSGLIIATRKARSRVPSLQSGGLFSLRIAEAMQDRCSREIDTHIERLDALLVESLDREQERRVLYLQGFAAEKTCYFDMFSKRYLSERAYRDLAFSVDLQADAMRHGGKLLEATLFTPRRNRFHQWIQSCLETLPGAGGLVRRIRMELTVREYERAWGRHMGCARVLSHLDESPETDHSHHEVLEEVRSRYRYWHGEARKRVDDAAAQFPEFVQVMQEELADRMVLHAQHESILSEAHAGLIPAGVAEKMLEDLDEHVRHRRKEAVSELDIDPTELLRKVPFFCDTLPEEFGRVAAKLRERTLPSDEVIIHQGQTGDSLFLIARGLVRVVRDQDGEQRDLATLSAGEFFGEIALLDESPRTATCRTVTPCALYELHRRDLDEVLVACPAMKEALEQAARKHKEDSARRSREPEIA